MPMKPARQIGLLLFGLCLSLIVTARELPSQPLPEFTQSSADAWINSEPLSVASLKGRVLLIDFWTFECWNCYRSFPWMNAMEKRLSGEPFRVIGIHSPEFDHERDRNRVEKKMTEFELHHAVMMDNDFAYWKAMNNRYWPAFYLVDKEGKLRHRFIGETHADTTQAERIESAIKALLAE